MSKIKSLIAGSAFALIVLGLPAIASAQYGGYDPYGRNGGYDPYGRNGQYGQYGTYGDTRSTVRDLKNRARDFQRELDRDLDRSRYNGTRREDQMNDLARRFRSAVDRLDNNALNGGNYGRNDNQLRDVFNEASQIERSIGRARVSYQSEAIWSGIRNDLQILSRYAGNGRGGYNNGGYPNGNYPNGNYPNGNYPNGNYPNGRNRNGLPSWWPF